MASGGVTLVVLFNHAFPQNIAHLRSLYASRFTDVMFVQPMERSAESDVRTSYRGSYLFHGMIVDVLDELLARRAEHYVFVQDDVLLNPYWDADELIERLGVGRGAFLPKFDPLAGPVHVWPWNLRSLWQIFRPGNPICGSGVEGLWERLPEAGALRRKLEDRYGFHFGPIIYDRDAPLPSLWNTFSDETLNEPLVRILLSGIFSHGDSGGDGDELVLPFPFCSGVADFFVVHADVLEEFGRVLGLFAAADFFAELAIPTALTCASHVTRAADVGLTTEYRWNSDRGGFTADDLAARFNGDLLLVHPVKLSKDRDLLSGVLQTMHRRIEMG